VTAGPDRARETLDKGFPVQIVEYVEQPTVENRVELLPERPLGYPPVEDGASTIGAGKG
jgi:hypothetical protein